MRTMATKAITVYRNRSKEKKAMTKRSIDTNIQLKRVTKSELDRLVESKNESYDHIVQRLIRFYKNNGKKVK